MNSARMHYSKLKSQQNRLLKKKKKKKEKKEKAKKNTKAESKPSLSENV